MAESFGPDARRAEAIKQAREQMLKDSSRLASGQKKAQRDDQQRRDYAERQDAASPVFLRPGDIQGDYDFAKALTTTLGGIRRVMTADDLVAFAKNIETLQEKYKKGISPRDVIDFSLRSDREKSNSEIFLCSPFSRKAGVFRFITNASLESKSSRHYVSVQFNDYSKFATNPKKPGGQLTRERLINSGIKFDCDCGRHTYWFRYLATTAGYALGRQEGGYPKLRNPNLYGVACKHVLRVMHWITSPLGLQYIRNQVEKDRKGQLGAVQRETEKQMRDRLQHQQDTAHHKRSQVQARHERPGYAKRMEAELAKKAKREAEAAVKANGQAAEAAARKTRARTLLQAGLITNEDYTILTGENP